MPVQINEVIIRAVVTPAPSTATTAAGCPPSGNSGEDAEILEKVLEIIREKLQR